MLLTLVTYVSTSKKGIVLDVHFARFFIRHFSGTSNNQYYSCVDDLPTFDPELAKNLSYVKNYDGDVEDLGLVFEWTEDLMGQMKTYELREG